MRPKTRAGRRMRAVLGWKLSQSDDREHLILVTHPEANFVHLYSIDSRLCADHVELAAAVENAHGHPLRSRLWFRFPAEYAPYLTDCLDPFLAGLLPLALTGVELHLHGRVSKRLLAGCGQISSMFRTWDPTLKQPFVRADSVVSIGPRGKQIGCFFTGGVDSFYTVLKNLDFESGGERITHLIFIDGMAGAPNNPDLVADIEKVAVLLGLKLIVVETNLFEYEPPPEPSWDRVASSRLAAVGLCLAPLFHRLIIPAGDTYAALSPWGSHPDVDPLWSTEGVEFRHDGCEASRSQKIEWRLSESAVALRYLHVCGYPRDGRLNCGLCEKCLRTLIALRILGLEKECPLFRVSLDLELVEKLDGGDRLIRYYLDDNLNLFERYGNDPDLGRALSAARRFNLVRWSVRNVTLAVRYIDRHYFGDALRRKVTAKAEADAVERTALRRNPVSWAFRHGMRKLAGRA